MTIEIGLFVSFLALALFAGLMTGFVYGLGEGHKMGQQDIRRLKRQMDGHKYQVGDIVEVWVDSRDTLNGTSSVYATVSRVYHLLDDHDYRLLLPGGLHSDIGEEDIKRRVSKGAA